MTITAKLDRTTERELIRKYQQTNDENCLARLLEAHDGYIRKMASKQFQLLKIKCLDYEDIVQEGRYGLIIAIKKFDLNRVSVNPKTNKVVKSQALLTYGSNYILSSIQALSHKSYSLKIPTHTLRSIQFNVKNTGSNTPERKELAKRAMRAESLNVHYDNSNYEHQNILTEKDPTFTQSNVFSPEIQKAIGKLTDKEWLIIKMRLGLMPNEEGMITKPKYIAEKLKMPLKEVEKTFNRAKKILTKNLANGNKYG